MIILMDKPITAPYSLLIAGAVSRHCGREHLFCALCGAPVPLEYRKLGECELCLGVPAVMEKAA